MHLLVSDDRKPNFIVRPARPDEREQLQELQRRASLANPGDRDSILSHPEVIDLPLEQILGGCVLVASTELLPLGFAVVLFTSELEAELDGLFVEPEMWRKGVARSLLQASCELAKSTGARSLHVIANHHASAFYSSSGFLYEREVHTQFGAATRMQLQL